MADEGHLSAHTRAGAAGDPPSSAAIDQADALPGRDPADLLAGSPDLDAQDVLALAAELSSAPRRARGRPAGALNRKNGDMVQYLAALGHRDPWVTLSLIQSADFGALCKMVGATSAKFKLAVLNVQRQAAEAIMNYHHAKKPQQLDMPGLGDKRPVMVIGEMNVTQIGGDAFMSAGIPPEAEKANEINGDAVRIGEAIPHEEAKPLDTLDKSGEGD